MSNKVYQIKTEKDSFAGDQIEIYYVSAGGIIDAIVIAAEVAQAEYPGENLRVTSAIELPGRIATRKLSQSKKR